MTKADVQQKSGVSTYAGMIAGLSLLLFAGALVASVQFSPEIQAAGEVLGTALRGRRLNVTIQTNLTAASPVGGTQIQVANPAGFVVGHQITIDAGLANTEVNRVHEIGMVTAYGTTLTLKYALASAHAIGAPVVVQEESLHQQSLHQSSSGSFGSLKSLDGSSGSIFRSSNSLQSSESGSSEGNLAKAGTGASAGGGLGSWAFSMLLMLCYGCIYKQKVVDPMGQMPKQSLQYEHPDDFRYGICDCMKDFNMCCMVMCCPLVRMAHTNQVADVCGFWETLCCLGCSAMCGIGPCCLNVYFRIHIKDHMGIQDHCFNDMILAWCCLPCITGQQALAVDEVMGFNFKFPCGIERSGMGAGGYGGENQALNWS